MTRTTSGFLRAGLAAAAALAALSTADTAFAQGKGYAVQWKQVGGRWKSGVVYAAAPQCPHESPQAACNEDFRGMYNEGEIAPLWSRGCNREPIRIQCSVQPLR